MRRYLAVALGAALVLAFVPSIANAQRGGGGGSRGGASGGGGGRGGAPVGGGGGRGGAPVGGGGSRGGPSGGGRSTASAPVRAPSSGGYRGPSSGAYHGSSAGGYHGPSSGAYHGSNHNYYGSNNYNHGNHNGGYNGSYYGRYAYPGYGYGYRSYYPGIGLSLGFYGGSDYYYSGSAPYYGNSGAAIYYGDSVTSGVPVTQSYSVPPQSPPEIAADEARMMIHVPSLEAQVWFNGALTSTQGIDREYRTTQLEPGKNYTYTVRVRWRDSNRDVDQTREVPVAAGRGTEVDFTRPEMITAPPPPPVAKPINK